MDLSTLSTDSGARKRRKRVGRGPGSGNGKTAGRGHKGQKARSGYSRRSGFEGGQMPLHRRLPKRGFHQEARFPMATINLDLLDKLFADGTEVTSELLVSRGLVHAMPGGVKVLGNGNVTKKLKLRVQAISAGAKSKVEAAGGAVEIAKVSFDALKHVKHVRASEGGEDAPAKQAAAAEAPAEAPATQAAAAEAPAGTPMPEEAASEVPKTEVPKTEDSSEEEE